MTSNLRCDDSSQCRALTVWRDNVEVCVVCGLWAGARTRPRTPDHGYDDRRGKPRVYAQPDREACE